MNSMKDYKQLEDFYSNECFDRSEELFLPIHLYGGAYYELSSEYDYEEKAKLKFYRLWVISKKQSSIEKQFSQIAEKWKNETGGFSTTVQKINDSYLDIIGMGKDVVPFILRDLQKPFGTAHWHYALKAITKENPVPEEDLNKNSKIKEAWITWGKNQNLI